jgi:hypothetical protein
MCLKGLPGDEKCVAGVFVVFRETFLLLRRDCSTCENFGFATLTTAGWVGLRVTSWAAPRSLVFGGAEQMSFFLRCFVHVSSRSPKSPWTKIMLFQVSFGRCKTTHWALTLPDLANWEGGIPLLGQFLSVLWPYR